MGRFHDWSCYHCVVRWLPDRYAVPTAVGLASEAALHNEPIRGCRLNLCGFASLREIFLRVYSWSGFARGLSIVCHQVARVDNLLCL